MPGSSGQEAFLSVYTHLHRFPVSVPEAFPDLLNTNEIVYNQFSDHMIAPNLSMIDVMMFNSKDDIKKMLQAYTLV